MTDATDRNGLVEMGLSLKLFGGFAVRDDSGADLSLRTRKMRALLAYLAVNADKPQPRERLMALLWGDRDERQARPSLNNALMAIRRLGGDGKRALLDSNASQVTLRAAAVECDVHRLRALLATDPAAAAERYDGPFLDGLSISEPAFEEWLTVTRSELHAAVCDALHRAANETGRAGEIHRAIDAARRLVALDPLREDGHRLLMRLLHESGDRVAALRQYQVCAGILKRDLQLEPDAATQELVDELRADKSSVAVSQSPYSPPGPYFIERPPLSPGKPAIAIMRFNAAGGEVDADIIAEGLTEDVTTALVKVPGIVVTPIQSPALSQGKAASSQGPGVGYVLDGTVRRHGDRLRCSVRLTDTAKGEHLWAERFHNSVVDIFEIQDEIVRQVLVELQVRLTEGDSARIESKGTRNLAAWTLRLQGAAELRSLTREGISRARDLFAASHREDPNWARPIAGLAACHFYDARNGWSLSRDVSLAAGIAEAERAIEKDPDDPLGYVVLRMFNVLTGDHDKAFALIEKAVSLAPGDHMSINSLGIQLIWMGHADRAVATFERGMRLAATRLSGFQRYYGLALHVTGRHDRAIAVLDDLARREPEYIEGLAQLAAAYVSAGRIDSARATVRKILAQDPVYTISGYLGAAIYFQDPKRTEWLRTLLVEAGLPE